MTMDRPGRGLLGPYRVLDRAAKRDLRCGKILADLGAEATQSKETLHNGTDSETGLVHGIATTAANVHDVTQAHRLWYGGERQARGDAGYIGV